MSKKIKIILWVTVIVILAVGIYIVIQIINNQGEGEFHGSVVRNCIASVLGSAPECSDDNGKLEPTYINNAYLGNMISVPEACWSEPETNPDCKPFIKSIRVLK